MFAMTEKRMLSLVVFHFFSRFDSLQSQCVKRILKRKFMLCFSLVIRQENEGVTVSTCDFVVRCFSKIHHGSHATISRTKIKMFKNTQQLHCLRRIPNELLTNYCKLVPWKEGLFILRLSIKNRMDKNMVNKLFLEHQLGNS